MTIHVVDRMKLAYSVVTELVRNGYVVLAVETNLFAPKPAIEIATPYQGSDLRGTPTVEVNDKGQPEQWTVTLMGGCRVRWRPMPQTDNAILPQMG